MAKQMRKQRPTVRWRRVVREAQWLIIVLLTTGATVVSGASSARAASLIPTQPSAGCRADSIDRASRHTIEVGGTQRGYILDVPERVRPHEPVPLVFDFHGFGDSAARLSEVSAFRPLAARDGFIVVYPDGLPVHLLGRDAPGWEIFSAVSDFAPDSDPTRPPEASGVRAGSGPAEPTPTAGPAGNRDLAFTAALLERLEAEYCIDEARVFATGFSNGAFFSHLLGCAMADRFAAIAPVSGGLITPCAPARTVPVIMHHGTHDPLVDVERARQARDAWLQIDHCRQASNTPAKKSGPPQKTQASSGCEWYHQCRNGAEVEYCENDGGHRWPADAAARIWDFFRNHPMAGDAPLNRRTPR